MLKLLRQVPFFYVFFRFLRKLLAYRYHYFILIQDIYNCYCETKLLRFKSDLKSKGKFLIFAPTDEDHNIIKLYSIFSTGFKNKGYSPLVIFEDRSSFIEKLYFKMFNINSFVYIRDYKLSMHEQVRVKRDSDFFLNDGLCYKSIKNWRYQDCLIGPQIISNLIRTNNNKTIDFNDKIIQKQV